MAPSRTAASATHLAIGPAVSWLMEIGTIPLRLNKPNVGLMPTMPLVWAGQMMEPSVSVPMAAAQKLAETAAPDPDEEPQADLSRA
jgi:hypothetical protein